MSDLRYVAIKSSSIQMQGWLTEPAVARNLAKRFCSLLIDPQLTEIGISERVGGCGSCSHSRSRRRRPRIGQCVSRRVLELTNKARTQARTCGQRIRGRRAAHPVGGTNRAALAHSRDMARRNYFEHEGLDGSQPATG